MILFVKRVKLLTLLAAAICSSAFAQDIVLENGKAYKLHTVAKGEGLYRLSVDNGLTQEDLLSANPQLSKTGLVEGVVIKIPISKDAQRILTQDGRAKAVHVTAAGETSYSISKKYGMTVVELLKLNPSLANGLREGQQLFVYAPSNAQGNSMGNTHTVRKGETLYGITKQYGVTIADFLKLNPGAASSLKEGDIVKLPSNAVTETLHTLHVIAQGETLYSIGIRYGVKPQQILDANPSLSPNAISVGTAIRIPQSRIPAEDASFYYHRMAQGETLYSLCVKYNVLQERITEFNPGLDWNAIKVGHVVAVPKANPAMETYYTNHEVARRETLFSISQDEGVSMDAILAANEGLTADNLQRGMVIRIPHERQVQGIRPATTDTAFIGNADEIQRIIAKYDYAEAGRPTITVFVMLPFRAWEEMNKLRSSGINTKANNYPFRSRRYVEFAEGIKLAADSLAKAGGNIDLRFFDSASRLDIINQLNGSEKVPDLIIGPAHKDEMAEVMAYAKRNHVPVVLPFAQCDSSIIDNPYIFQASVIDTISTKHTLREMANRTHGHNVILIKPGANAKIDQEKASFFKKACADAGVWAKEFAYDTKNPTAFFTALDTTVTNVVVMPTNNEARANSVLTSLASVIEQKPWVDIELWTTSDWLGFQTIEIDVFHRLSTKVFTTFAVDERNPRTASVLKAYRKRYFTEPVAFTPYFQRLKQGSGYSEYGLWGYDVAFKFIGARLFHGPQFIRTINAFRPDLAQSNFEFRNLTNWGGSVNVGLKTIRFAKDGSVMVQNL